MSIVSFKMLKKRTAAPRKARRKEKKEKEKRERENKIIVGVILSKRRDPMHMRMLGRISNKYLLSRKSTMPIFRAFYQCHVIDIDTGPDESSIPFQFVLVSIVYGRGFAILVCSPPGSIPQLLTHYLNRHPPTHQHTNTLTPDSPNPINPKIQNPNQKPTNTSPHPATSPHRPTTPSPSRQTFSSPLQSLRPLLHL